MDAEYIRLISEVNKLSWLRRKEPNFQQDRSFKIYKTQTGVTDSFWHLNLRCTLYFCISVNLSYKIVHQIDKYSHQQPENSNSNAYCAFVLMGIIFSILFFYFFLMEEHFLK